MKAYLQKHRANRCEIPVYGVVTCSVTKLKETERVCKRSYQSFRSKLDIFPDIPLLERNNHKEFLLKGLKNLSKSYECLDASRPWLCYWILHSLDLLDYRVSEEQALGIAEFLGKCQPKTGGFAGGPLQFAHLAPTYAAVNALCILATVTEKVFDVLDRPGLYRFLMSVREKDGSFKMHEGGEVDIRGAYCAASAASLTNMCTKALFAGTPEWICRCQTYEGGFAGFPGQEAHGGYSFCGLAALVILNRTDMCDLAKLLRWTSMRQMKYEGGFQGRTNKLVDGCYSFWQGGAFLVIHMVLCQEDDRCLSATNWMFNQQALQEYVLICCQDPLGGLVDKPGKPRDHYHTCYCLSGLSMAQQFTGGKLAHTNVVGSPENLLRVVHPVFNLTVEAVAVSSNHFKHQGVPSSSPTTTPMDQAES